MPKKKTNEELRRENTRLWREKKAVEGELQKTQRELGITERLLGVERSRRRSQAAELAEVGDLVGHMARFIGSRVQTANTATHKEEPHGDI